MLQKSLSDNSKLSLYSTLPRGKKDISHPLPNRNDNYTAKHLVSSENDNKPVNDHDNLEDEVRIIICGMI